MKKKVYQKPTLNIVPIRACQLLNDSPSGPGESRRDDWDD